MSFYENNMRAWMSNKQNVYLGAYQNVQHSFWLWFSTEATNDYFEYYYSYDSTNWYRHGGSYSGNSGGWVEVIHNIPNDADFYYMNFKFTSNNSISNYSGVFIDDIIIDGEVPPKLANLTYDTPSGWDGPLVLSHDTGTHLNTILYGGSDTYFDFAIKNDGDTACQTTTTAIYIDDVLNSYNWAWGLEPLNFDSTINDADITLSEGWHTIKMIIDDDNVVDEVDETDNIYEITEFWYPPEITVIGEVEYNLPIHMIPNWSMARNFRVELWDADNNGPDEFLDSTYTDDWGAFAFNPVFNYEDDNTFRDIYVKVFAQNSAAMVSDTVIYADSSTTWAIQAHPYWISTDTIWEVPSGNYAWTPPFHPPIIIDTSESGYFYIADILKWSRNEWLNLRPNEIPRVVSCVNMAGVGTGYVSSWNVLYVEDGQVSYGYNTYNNPVIHHEYGHHLHKQFLFFDSSQGDTTHGITDTISEKYASSEGFASFWSFHVRGTPFYHIVDNNFRDTVWINFENGMYGDSGFFNNRTRGTANHLSIKNEVTVGGILWDIYDDQPDDYSGQVDWGSISLNVTPDSIKDSLYDDIDNILSTLLDRNVDGHRPDNITEFWEAWFQAPSFGHDQAMADIWYEHGIIKTASCCIGIRGNADNDPLDHVDISDQVYIVDFIFTGGPAPVCTEEGNADGDIGENIDISDLIYLVDFIFGNPQGPPPPSCP